MARGKRISEHSRHGLLRIGLTVIAIGLVGTLAATRPAGATVLLSCDQATIQGVAPDNTTIISATPVTAPVTYCDVRGSIATSSNGQNNTVLFALGLPNDWRGDFVFIGNGGFAGSIQAVNEGEYVPSIADGLATAATDTGHESPFGPALGSLDGSFGLSGGQPALAAREDFAYRAVHLSTVSSEAITGAYYNSPMYSYFDGCSTGGRQALVEAEKFPTDFNGILAGDPAIGNPIAGYNWNDQALLKYSQAYLSPADITTIDQAVLAECDGLDGKVDGLIQDPRKCNFNPIKLLCTGGKQTGCLNLSQVQTLQTIYAGAGTNGLAAVLVGRGNASLYPGYMASDPDGPDGWDEWITGFLEPQFGVADPWGTIPTSLEIAPFQWSFQDQFMKYFVFNNPNYNSLSFGFTNPANVAALNASVTQFQANGENANLAPFFKAGGKLIMYHGWSDPALTPLVSVDFYTAVAQQIDGGSLSKLQNNARLFMVPGMHHCAGGPGPNVFDALTPLGEWVQFGIAPTQIIAAHYTDNNQSLPIDRTMPLCPYPQQAKYTHGPVDEASSWVCKNP